MNTKKPLLVIIMGVSGVGKSTIASKISDQLGMTLIEADDFHSNESVQLMSQGTPLTDDLRQSWIERLCRVVDDNIVKNHSMVMAYSGLKEKHRQQFNALSCSTLFLLLDVPFESLKERLSERTDHFFPESLLQSQFDDFDPIKNCSNERIINADNPPKRIARECLELIKGFQR